MKFEHGRFIPPASHFALSLQCFQASLVSSCMGSLYNIDYTGQLCNPQRRQHTLKLHPVKESNDSRSACTDAQDAVSTVSSSTTALR